MLKNCYLDDFIWNNHDFFLHFISLNVHDIEVRKRINWHDRAKAIKASLYNKYNYIFKNYK